MSPGESNLRFERAGTAGDAGGFILRGGSEATPRTSQRGQARGRSL